MDASSLVIGPHARERMEQMNVVEEELRCALDPPDLSYRASEPDRRVYVGGRLAVIVDERDNRVVTVFWHGTESRDDYYPEEEL